MVIAGDLHSDSDANRLGATSSAAGVQPLLFDASADPHASRDAQEVRIVIPPAFERTGAFLVLCVVAIVALIGFLFWIRVRQVSTVLQQRMEARLAERDRIARDLHDTLLQGTEGLILKVYAAARQLPEGDPTREALSRSVDQAEQLAIEGRLKLLGLVAHTRSRQELSLALGALGMDLAAESGITFRALKKGRVRPVESTSWDEVFGIAREAINNALKHSTANLIEVTITYEASTLGVQIRDDGCGMSKEWAELSGGHIGLRVMRERAKELLAELQIDTGGGGGTTVRLLVPSEVAYHRHR
jgi:signal transduction histidine kinase